jgi:hypothetical protein
MTLRLIFWSILAVVTLVILPILLIWTMINHLRGRGSERRGTGGITAGIAGAMQELDRITTRPSVEHKVEAERPILKREDDSDGE